MNIKTEISERTEKQLQKWNTNFSLASHGNGQFWFPDSFIKLWLEFLAPNGNFHVIFNKDTMVDISIDQSSSNCI